jgi:sorbitol-specific phosphotransferase system component IIA
MPQKADAARIMLGDRKKIKNCGMLEIGHLFIRFRSEKKKKKRGRIPPWHGIPLSLLGFPQG